MTVLQSTAREIDSHKINSQYTVHQADDIKRINSTYTGNCEEKKEKKMQWDASTVPMEHTSKNTREQVKWIIFVSPWIWLACKSIVIMWSAPETDNIFATNLAVMGARDLSFLSCLAYGKQGITAVTRAAEAILHALIIINSSIRWSFTSRHPDWII